MGKSKLKNKNGITLIALVVTIIVLLILAGISIAMLTGRNGILSRAGEARYANSIAEFEEKVRLAQIALQAEITNKSRVNPGYIATEEPNSSGLAGNVASEMGVTAIQGGSSASTGATKVAKITSRSGATRGTSGATVNTEGYTVSYYLDTPGNDTTDGTGYIAIWYTNNSLRSNIDRDEVVDKYGIVDVAKATTSRNQVVLVAVIKVENYGCSLSNTGLTSTTDGNADIKKGTYEATTLKEKGLIIASTSSGNGSSGGGENTGNGSTGNNDTHAAGIYNSETGELIVSFANITDTGLSSEGSGELYNVGQGLCMTIEGKILTGLCLSSSVKEYESEDDKESYGDYYVEYWDDDDDLLLDSYDFVVPDFIEEIAPGVFANRTKLKNVEIPSSVKKLGYNLFKNTDITKLVIPNSVKSIDMGLLGGEGYGNCKIKELTLPNCNYYGSSELWISWNVYENLQVINFEGTEEKWLSIVGYDSVEEWKSDCDYDGEINFNYRY